MLLCLKTGVLIFFGRRIGRMLGIYGNQAGLLIRAKNGLLFLFYSRLFLYGLWGGLF